MKWILHTSFLRLSSRTLAFVVFASGDLAFVSAATFSPSQKLAIGRADCFFCSDVDEDFALPRLVTSETKNSCSLEALLEDLPKQTKKMKKLSPSSYIHLKPSSCLLQLKTLKIGTFW